MTQEVETTVGPDVQPDIVINPHAVVGQHSHSDTVILPFVGAVTAPGGIYTVVFGGLGVLTIIEVLLAPILDSLNAPLIKVVALMGLAVVKALLVVMFYMHLREDNRVFRLILGLPLLIVVLGVLYLLSVPPDAGLGYPLTATPTETPIASATPLATATSEAALLATVEVTAEATDETAATSEPVATAEAAAATSEPAATVEAAATDETAATAEATTEAGS